MDKLHTPSLSFDRHGHLFPYETIELTMPQFEAFFVDGLEDQAHRRRLFKQYLKYLELLKKEVGVPLFQWINGSFTTLKLFPEDIDFVSFLTYAAYSRSQYERAWLKAEAKLSHGLDSSFTYVCPEHHPNFDISLEYRQNWQDLFGYGREDVNKKRHPKGIIQITF